MNQFPVLSRKFKKFFGGLSNVSYTSLAGIAQYTDLIIFCTTHALIMGVTDIQQHYFVYSAIYQTNYYVHEENTLTL